MIDFAFIATTDSVLIWNSTGTTVAGVGGAPETASNELNLPFGLFLDSSFSLYIADYSNHRIQKWLAGASSGTTVAGQANGANGSNGSYLYQPSGVLVDSSGSIYVADMANFRVQLWPSGATSGTTIAGTTGKRAITSSGSSLYACMNE